MMGHPSRVPHVFCQCGNFVSSLGNLGQGGKTGETKAPIAKWQRINALSHLFRMFEGGGPKGLLDASPAGLQGEAQGVNPEPSG
jgi:hypothetical protein